MLTRLLYNFVDAVLDPLSFQQFIVGPAMVLPPWLTELLRRLSLSTDVCVSTSARGSSGKISAGDVVFYSNPAVLGTVKLVLRAVSGEGDAKIWVVIAPFKYVRGPPGVWSNEELPPVVVECSLLSSAKVNIVVGGCIYV